MPRVRNPQMIEPCLVRVTMKDKEYTAMACGFDFEEGVAEKVIDMKDHGKDRNALQNVMTLFPGTSYKVLEELNPEELNAPTPAEPAEEVTVEEVAEETAEPQYSASDIRAMRKAELQDLCEKLDVEVDDDATVPELKDALIEALGLDGDSE